MSGKVSPRLAASSDIITIFGYVYKAHSRARWEGSFPISLMKYQYFVAEALSVSILPISWE